METLIALIALALIPAISHAQERPGYRSQSEACFLEFVASRKGRPVPSFVLENFRVLSLQSDRSVRPLDISYIEALAAQGGRSRSVTVVMDVDGSHLAGNRGVHARALDAAERFTREGSWRNPVIVQDGREPGGSFHLRDRIREVAAAGEPGRQAIVLITTGLGVHTSPQVAGVEAKKLGVPIHVIHLDGVRFSPRNFGYPDDTAEWKARTRASARRVAEISGGTFRSISSSEGREVREALARIEGWESARYRLGIQCTNTKSLILQVVDDDGREVKDLELWMNP